MSNYGYPPHQPHHDYSSGPPGGDASYHQDGGYYGYHQEYDGYHYPPAGGQPPPASSGVPPPVSQAQPSSHQPYPTSHQPYYSHHQNHYYPPHPNSHPHSHPHSQPHSQPHSHPPPHSGHYHHHPNGNTPPTARPARPTYERERRNASSKLLEIAKRVKEETALFLEKRQLKPEETAQLKESLKKFEKKKAEEFLRVGNVKGYTDAMEAKRKQLHDKLDYFRQVKAINVQYLSLLDEFLSMQSKKLEREKDPAKKGKIADGVRKLQEIRDHVAHPERMHVEKGILFVKEAKLAVGSLLQRKKAYATQMKKLADQALPLFSEYLKTYQDKLNHEKDPSARQKYHSYVSRLGEFHEYLTNPTKLHPEKHFGLIEEVSKTFNSLLEHKRKVTEQQKQIKQQRQMQQQQQQMQQQQQQQMQQQQQQQMQQGYNLPHSYGHHPQQPMTPHQPQYNMHQQHLEEQKQAVLDRRRQEAQEKKLERQRSEELKLAEQRRAQLQEQQRKELEQRKRARPASTQPGKEPPGKKQKPIEVLDTPASVMDSIPTPGKALPSTSPEASTQQRDAIEYGPGISPTVEALPSDCKFENIAAVCNRVARQFSGWA